MKKAEKGARKSVEERRKEQEARKNPKAAKEKSEKQKQALLEELLKSSGKNKKLLKF